MSTHVLMFWAFVALMVLIGILTQVISFKATEVWPWVQSKATVQGMDIGARTSLYWLGLAGVAIVLSGAAWIVHRTRPVWLGPLVQEEMMGWGLGLILFSMAMLMGHDTLPALALLTLLLLFEWLAVLRKTREGSSETGKEIALRRIWICLLFNLLLICGFFMPWTGAKAGLTFSICWLGLYFFVGRWVLEGNSILSAAVHKFFRALAWTPWLVFTAVELHFLWSTGSGTLWPAGLIFMILWAGVAIISGLIPRSWARPDPGSWNLKRTYIPGALSAFLLLVWYQPLVTLPQNTFELANPANALMRIFSFNEIPFLDFTSSHFTSEQFYGILYHMLHGYDNTGSFLAWKFLYSVLALFLGFLVLRHVLRSPWKAFMVMLVLPFYELLFPLHFLYLSPLLLAVYLWIRTQRPLWLFLWLTYTFLMTVWRPDIGFIAVLLILFFGIFFYGRFPGRGRNWLQGLLPFSGLMLVLVFVALTMRGWDYLWTNFRDLLEYLGAEQAHGLVQIVPGWDWRAILHYLIFPVLALFALMVEWWRTRPLKGRSLIMGPGLWAAFFLFIYLINFPRGLVRHGFIEGSDHYLNSVFYLGLTLFIWGSGFMRTKRYLLTFLAIASALILILKYFEPAVSPGTNQVFKANGAEAFKLNISELEPGSRILNAPEWAPHIQAAIGIENHLSSNASFIDLTNSPILYYWTERRIPSYFCQSLQNSVTPYQMEQLVRRTREGNFPMVLFHAVPLEWGDRTDQVENILRYYILADFIYQNYRPVGLREGRSVWWWRSSDTLMDAQEEKELHYSMYPVRYRLGHAPALLARSLAKRPEVMSDSLWIGTGQNGSVRVPRQRSVPGEQWILWLEIGTGNAEQAACLSLKDAGGLTLELDFEPIASKGLYAFILNNHYLWHATDTLEVSVSINGSNTENATYWMSKARFK